jgi:hypothetical protein
LDEKMALMENFIIPTIKVIFYIAVFGSLAFFISRAIVKRWTKTWKYFFKYKVFKRTMPEKEVAWCMEAIEIHNMPYSKAKQYLYLKGKTSQSKVNETMYIFTQIYKILKGGKYGRISSRSNSEIKGTEDLPRFES